VDDPLPSVTVLIAARPGQAEVKAVAASKALDYPTAKLEIIMARGKQPSAQRNAGMKAARGDLIYFLDDDSVPEPGSLRRAVAHFTDPKVKMVGGANVCPGHAPPLEQVFALVLGSWLAFGPSRARYRVVGKVRETSEKELILCNLLARREPVMALGGFDEALYPNEENALMDQLQKRGNKLLYDPQFVVRRRPRPTLGAFCRMLMNYGRGRAEQFRLHPTGGSALNLVPPLFCAYLLAVPLLAWLFPAGLWPLAAYGLAIGAQTLACVPRHGLRRSLLALPLQALTHVCYGLGFWRGLFTPLQGPPPALAAEVSLQTISVKG
jgi:hypothetical protein